MGTPYGSHLHIFAESEAPLAEGEGFKPPIPERGIPDFESSAIDHSANLPNKREQKRACSHFVEREEGQLKLNLPCYMKG